jgi:hypothetical protein
MSLLRSKRNFESITPSFINWLSNNDNLLIESDADFSSFKCLYKQLYTSLKPVRIQSTSYNCTLFSLWIAIEVLTNELPKEPSFMKTKIPSCGITIHDFLNKPSTQNSLAKYGLKAVSMFNYKIYVLMKVKSTQIKQWLLRGPLIVGISINMFDDKNHIRAFEVKRRFSSGKLDSCVIHHSVCLVGYCTVKGQGYFITKDSQEPEELGCNNGCVLLPEEEIQRTTEVFCLEKLGTYHSIFSSYEVENHHIIPALSSTTGIKENNIIDLTKSP